MSSVVQGVLQRSLSRTFLQSFGLILAAEAVVICVAWVMLGLNTSAWIRDQTTQLVQISKQDESIGDWSHIGDVLADRNNALRKSYSLRLKNLSKPLPGDAGAVYLVVLAKGHAYEVYEDDAGSVPSDVGKPDPWELEAYSTKKTTFTPIPHSDESGTYLAAFTPVVVNGRVVGLVAVERDSATLADFQGIVRRAFWLSIIPAILVSLIISYVVACMFVDPMEVFRAVEESAKDQRGQRSDIPDSWSSLTVREKEVVELVRQGLTNQQIADKASVALDTVKTHLKNISKKTGLTKLQLAVEAQARRQTSGTADE